MDQETIFHVSNKHGTDCGEPPHVDGNTPGHYHGYFENEHGEQMLFVYDYQTHAGTLWVGDAGWEKPHTVANGEVPALVLDQNERLWLQACWQAATALRK